MTSIMEEHPPAIAEVRPLAAPVIDRVVQVAMAKKPEDRWQSARDIAFLLQSPAIAGGLARPVAARRRGMWVAVAAGLLCGALLTTGVLLRRNSGETHGAKIRSILDVPADNILEEFGAIALSPDGRSIAFLTRHDKKTLLHVQRLDGTNQEVVPTSEQPHFPFWSPDSRYVGSS